MKSKSRRVSVQGSIQGQEVGLEGSRKGLGPVGFGETRVYLCSKARGGSDIGENERHTGGGEKGDGGSGDVEKDKGP